MTLINQRWPEDLAPETCEFGRSWNDNLQLSPVTRKEKVIRMGRPLWRARMTWVMPNTERLAKLRYYLNELDGFSGSVQLWDFSARYPGGLAVKTIAGDQIRLKWLGVGLGTNFWSNQVLPQQWVSGNTATLLSTANAGAVSVTVSGLTASTIAAVQGQYIQIGRRLHVVAATVSANSSGNATISITPPILNTVVFGDPVYLADAGCEMRLEDQSFSASASAGNGLVSVSASFVETVEDYA